MRQDNENALNAAKILHSWVKETERTNSPSIKIKVYNELWELIKERIQVLVKNGISGLILILITLFLFLQRRVAFWISGRHTSFFSGCNCNSIYVRWFH